MIEGTDAVMVRVAETTAEIANARRFQATRYLAAGFVDSIPRSGMIEDEWVEASTYHVALDAAGEMVGVCRFVGPSERSLPMLRHFDLYPEWEEAFRANADSVYEMGALATVSSLGAFTVVLAMYRQSIRQFRVNPGQVHLLAATDTRLFRASRRFLHVPVRQVGETKHYLGSETTPGYLYLPAGLERQVEKAPTVAKYFTDFDTLDLVNEEIIDLRDRYPELMPTEEVIDLTDVANATERLRHKAQ